MRLHVFFPLFSTITITVNRVAKIMQSAYLCVIFHVKHKKSSFLILGTMVAKMTTIVGDVAGLQQSQRPSTKGKIAFRNTATYHGGSMNVRVRLRVNSLERQTFVSEKRQQS